MAWERAPKRVVSRLLTYWRGCKSSRTKVAGVVAAIAELGASSHWVLPGDRLQS